MSLTLRLLATAFIFAPMPVWSQNLQQPPTEQQVEEAILQMVAPVFTVSEVVVTANEIGGSIIVPTVVLRFTAKLEASDDMYVLSEVLRTSTGEVRVVDQAIVDGAEYEVFGFAEGELIRETWDLRVSVDRLGDLSGLIPRRDLGNAVVSGTPEELVAREEAATLIAEEAADQVRRDEAAQQAAAAQAEAAAAEEARAREEREALEAERRAEEARLETERAAQEEQRRLEAVDALVGNWATRTKCNNEPVDILLEVVGVGSGNTVNARLIISPALSWTSLESAEMSLDLIYAEQSRNLTVEEIVHVDGSRQWLELTDLTLNSEATGLNILLPVCDRVTLDKLPEGGIFQPFVTDTVAGFLNSVSPISGIVGSLDPSRSRDDGLDEVVIDVQDISEQEIAGSISWPARNTQGARSRDELSQASFVLTFPYGTEEAILKVFENDRGETPMRSNTRGGCVYSTEVEFDTGEVSVVPLEARAMGLPCMKRLAFQLSVDNVQ